MRLKGEDTRLKRLVADREAGEPAEAASGAVASGSVRVSITITMPRDPRRRE